MLIITISEPAYDRVARRFSEVTVAKYLLDGTSLMQVAGDPYETDPSDIVLTDPSTGADVTIEQDPDLWAQLLPTAFRAGDQRVRIADAGSRYVRKQEVASEEGGIIGEAFVMGGERECTGDTVTTGGEREIVRDEAAGSTSGGTRARPSRR